MGDEQQQPNAHGHPPPEFICPITLDLIVDPVVGVDGRSYGRQALMHWFEARVGDGYGPTLPVSRKLQDPSTLVPNRFEHCLLTLSP